MVNIEDWKLLQQEFVAKRVILVAVSKRKPAADILELYHAGQRDFGENYVQELLEKEAQLPKDIRWHFIGHLQANKVKYIAPFVHLIHAVDDLKLLTEISKQGLKNNRVIDVLLQMHIAAEDTKFGMDENEIAELIKTYMAERETSQQHVRICGLMGMATNTDNAAQIHKEFARLHAFFGQLGRTALAGDAAFTNCSMGMSGDYQIAIEEGGNMVRIGSLLFGART